MDINVFRKFYSTACVVFLLLEFSLLKMLS